MTFITNYIDRLIMLVVHPLLPILVIWWKKVQERSNYKSHGKTYRRFSASQNVDNFDSLWKFVKIQSLGTLVLKWLLGLGLALVQGTSF